MRAMVLHSQAKVERSPLVMTDLPDPMPGDGEVRVRVAVCAVCRTDLHIIEGDLPLRRSPIVPGHQVVGVVDQVGPNCRRFMEGDRVGIAWLRSTDGTCRYCRRGQENLCPASQYTGYHTDGGYAEYVVVPEAFAYTLPEAMDDVTVSPLLCAGIIGYRAMARAAVPARGSVVLIGFGSSAHLVMQLLVHRGCRVFVVTRGRDHQAFARQMGATWAGAACEDLPELMDSAILFAPIGTLVPPAMAALDKGGTLAIAGIHLTDVPVMVYQKHLFHEKQIRSVEANTREDGRNMLRQAADAGVEPHVHVYDLADANQALVDLKQSRFDGTAVLRIQ